MTIISESDLEFYLQLLREVVAAVLKLLVLFRGVAYVCNTTEVTSS
jgi:hypothetical protein